MVNGELQPKHGSEYFFPGLVVVTLRCRQAEALER